MPSHEAAIERWPACAGAMPGAGPCQTISIPVCVQFRTSYFPGLGWMLRRELWLELGPKFPKQAWDHWMRLASTSQGSANLPRPPLPVLSSSC